MPAKKSFIELSINEQELLKKYVAPHTNRNYSIAFMPENERTLQPGKVYAELVKTGMIHWKLLSNSRERVVHDGYVSWFELTREDEPEKLNNEMLSEIKDDLMEAVFSEIDSYVHEASLSSSSHNPKDRRRLDSLSYLCEGNSICVAAAFLEQRGKENNETVLYLASNKAELKQDGQGNVHHARIEAIMQYLKELATEQHKLPLKKSNEIFHTICNSSSLFQSTSRGMLRVDNEEYVKQAIKFALDITDASTIANHKKILQRAQEIETQALSTGNPDHLERIAVGVATREILKRRKHFLKVTQSILEHNSEISNSSSSSVATENVFTNAQFLAIQQGRYEILALKAPQKNAAPQQKEIHTEERKVHAELRIVEKILALLGSGDLVSEEIYLGISKKCCQRCHMLMDVINQELRDGHWAHQIVSRASHNIYGKPENWVLPQSIRDARPDVDREQTLEEAIQIEYNSLHRNVRTISEKMKNFIPTEDVKRALDKRPMGQSSSDSDAAKNHALEVAQNHLKDAEKLVNLTQRAIKDEMLDPMARMGASSTLPIYKKSLLNANLMVLIAKSNLFETLLDNFPQQQNTSTPSIEERKKSEEDSNVQQKSIEALALEICQDVQEDFYNIKRQLNETDDTVLEKEDVLAILKKPVFTLNKRISTLSMAALESLEKRAAKRTKVKTSTLTQFNNSEGASISTNTAPLVDPSPTFSDGP